MRYFVVPKCTWCTDVWHIYHAGMPFDTLEEANKVAKPTDKVMEDPFGPVYNVS